MWMRSVFSLHFWFEPHYEETASELKEEDSNMIRLS